MGRTLLITRGHFLVSHQSSAVSILVVHRLDACSTYGMFDRLLTFLGGRSSAADVFLAYGGGLFNYRRALVADQANTNAPTKRRLRNSFREDNANIGVPKIPVER